MHSDRYKQLKPLVGVDVEFIFIGFGYAHTKYKILKNDAELSDEDLAIICDKGNLPFGFRREGNVICVYTD